MSRRYREIPADAIPARTRLAATNAAAFAATHFEIPPPVIRWFEDCPTTSAEAFAGLVNGMTPGPPADSFEEEQGILGKAEAAEPDTIWVKAWMGAQRSCEVVLHEACHAFQRHLMGPAQGRLEFDGREEQARTYEADSLDLARAIATTTPYEGESNA
jgi:hypothetical protein